MLGLFSIGEKAIDLVAQLLAIAEIPPCFSLNKKLCAPVELETKRSEFPQLYITVSSSSMRRGSP
jgi:hypothetical protein